ncbi:MAG TPA: hypothetical protein VN193_17635 [Candidatus Angelobacter sp.]|nr:hypothetical protein [Candidatus Angelobacter sp.]
MGRRGPGAGLRQAATAGEAMQWLHLFDALGSPHVVPLIHHLSLRSVDAAALQQLCPPVAESLRRILAATRDGGQRLARVNEVLAAAYLELERGACPRLARGVFALASDGLPDDDDVRLMARWERPMRRLLDDFDSSGLPARRRDVVVAMVGHHLAAVDALTTAATQPGARWLVTLIRWRRFASLGRALAQVLSAAERQQLAAYTRADLAITVVTAGARPVRAAR